LETSYDEGASELWEQRALFVSSDLLKQQNSFSRNRLEEKMRDIIMKFGFAN
jgi:hypothetical protein